VILVTYITMWIKLQNIIFIDKLLTQLILFKFLSSGILPRISLVDIDQCFKGAYCLQSDDPDDGDSHNVRNVGQYPPEFYGATFQMTAIVILKS
jgi:hypothetical protein